MLTAARGRAVEQARSGSGASHDTVSEGLSIDAALLKITDRSTSENGSLGEAQNLLAPLEIDKPSRRRSLGAKSRDFFANYFYDFGNPLLAAELWVESGASKGNAGDGDISRAASAFYIAKLNDNARQLWIALVNSESGIPIKSRSYYNLAATEPKDADKNHFLQMLLAGDSDITSAHVLYGMILYTRLLPDKRAAAIIAENPAIETEPLLDLELFRRTLASKPAEKSVADTWLLLDRHNADPQIYQWAAWYFDYERRFDESGFLVKTADKRGVSGGAWLAFDKAINLILNNDYSGGAQILKDAEPAWYILANLALIFEAQRDFNGAYSNFLSAAAMLDGETNLLIFQKNIKNEKAALLQLKIAQCLSALGRKDEAHEAVLKAASIYPDNIKVRMALDRVP
jgi:hypothetical protein